MAEQSTITKFTIDPSRRYYFVGVGGVSMSGLALTLLSRGVRVGGSDRAASSLLDRLTAAGAQVHVGHDAAHLTREDVLILSDAIKPDNPEWMRARAWGLPIYKRADLLGYVVNSARGVAVSGTHGKTTTSGMLSLIFIEAGMDPTCMLGGDLVPLGGNLRLGSDLMVVEACEAYESFLYLEPEAAIVTNIEVDHLDHHGTPEHLFESFRQFLRQVRDVAIVNGDDALLRTMTALAPRTVTYGAGEDNDYRFVDVHLSAEPSFTLLRHGEAMGSITLRVPGLHLVSNATGAAALALELGADFAAIQRGLAAFPGVHRRFERMGRLGAAAVVDDYAHHPTEIRATLAAARAAFPGRVIAVFQPHLYSRTRDLLDDFGRAFADADAVLIAPIYAARELPIPGIDHLMLANRLAATQPETPIIALSTLLDAVQLLRHAAMPAGELVHAAAIPSLRDGDVIITIGAGDVDAVARALVSAENTEVQC